MLNLQAPVFTGAMLCELPVDDLLVTYQQQIEIIAFTQETQRGGYYHVGAVVTAHDIQSYCQYFIHALKTHAASRLS
jgi:hypothetical protein